MVKKNPFRADNCVHFRLVHNSGRATDQTPTVMQAFIPDRLLKKGVNELPEDKLEAFADSCESEDEVTASASDDEGLDGDCYFPPDGYDYDQHLCYLNEARLVKAELTAVSGDLPSLLTVEEQQVIAALDDDEDAYEVLSDDGCEDFFEQLTHSRPAVTDSELLWGGFIPTLPEVFLRPNMAQRKLIVSGSSSDESSEEDADDIAAFDSVLAEYEDEFIGAGEEDVEFDELNAIKITESIRKTSKPPTLADISADVEEIAEIAEISKKLAENQNEDEWEFRVIRSKKDKWDCESILSLRSNISNHPSIVPSRVGTSSRPKKIPCAQNQNSALPSLPEDEDDLSWLTQDLLKTSQNSQIIPLNKITHSDDSSDDSIDTIKRTPDETSEEKRARKAAVKAAQKAARIDKKINENERHRKELSKNARLAGNGDVRAKTAVTKL